ncbi:MAG: hypothetical protein JSU74_11165 [Candidatus Zixiibacteriota bacterium]|nr:MAG: hypothetical protein JSU74_11165 [candidate division Zixibacteria bacterium]
MARKTTRNRIIFLVLTVLIFAAGLVFWLYGLSADPPLYFSGMGQSLSTDPAQYVYHARNKAVFGDSDPFDYPRWLVYQRSLTSLTAYIWFSLAGVSLGNANVVGIILSLGALIIFLVAVLRFHRPWVGAAVTVCYMMNITMLVHGRLSYLENGLTFIAALLFLFYSQWGKKTWALVASGALVAVAMLLGKLFGVLLLPALLLTDWFSGEEKRVRRAVTMIVSFAIAAVILVFVLYGTKLSAVYGYFGEQSYGLRGFPKGLASPWAFFEHLISYGFRNRFFFLDFDLLVFMWAGGALLTYLMVGGYQLNRLSPIVRLSMFAVPCIFLGLMPLNYSPVRYALFLIPPIIVFCFGLMDHMLANPPPETRQAGWVRYILILLLAWQALFHLVGTVFFIDYAPIPILTWATLPGAIGIALLVRSMLNRRKIVVSKKLLYISLGVVLLFSVGLNAYRIGTRVLVSHNISIKEANADLRGIVGDQAVVSGPYGPVLTLDNDLMSFIHLFGVASVDSSLFLRYPITHLAIDTSNWAEAVKCYPDLEGMKPITAYWIRDYIVKICNVSKFFGNPEAARYRETLYEKAVQHYFAGHTDSAVFALETFMRGRPRNRSANMFYVEMLLAAGRLQEAAVATRQLAARHPSDYYTNLVCGRSLQIIGLLVNDPSLVQLAERYYEKAVRNNPFKASYAQSIWDQTHQMYSGKGRSSGNSP